MKYLYYSQDGFSSVPVLNANGRSGDWFLYRAAGLIEHFAEAANRDGKYKLAYALMNGGIGPTYDDPSTTDKTNSMQTFLPPPYDFDARFGDNPSFRATYYKNRGLRERAYLRYATVTNPTDSLRQVEDIIMNEGALELAYEGQRWSDLLRVALRRNDPSYVAKKVGDKLRKDGLGAEAAKAEARLSTIDGLYLPFKWK